MTLNDLQTVISLAHTMLGFEAEEDTTLYSLMRQTTPRRAERAIAAVIDDDSCTTTLERYNRLLELLRPAVALPRR